MTLIHSPISFHIWLKYMSLMTYSGNRIVLKLPFFRKTAVEEATLFAMDINIIHEPKTRLL